MPLQKYDPKFVFLVYGGALITGYAPDTFIEIERNADLYSLKIGCDGEACRSKSNDKGTRVTITLMPGSQGNTILMGASQGDDASPVGLPLPLAVTDVSTASTFNALEAWVVKDPGYTFSKEAEPKKWVLEMPDLIAFHGAAATGA